MASLADCAHKNPSEAQLTKMLRERRRARGLSFEELASTLGVSVRDYVEREYARVRFSAEELRKLSRVLGLDVERLIDDLFRRELPSPGE